MANWGWLLLGLTVMVGCANPAANHTQVDPAVAENPAGNQAQTLTVTCSGCHAVGNEVIRPLQGYQASELERLLTLYRDEPNGATAMHRMARGFTDSEIQLIANELGD